MSAEIIPVEPDAVSTAVGRDFFKSLFVYPCIYINI